ncbi:MAG: patatin-like phospholipase family protein [Saprospiraceae bacterium]
MKSIIKSCIIILLTMVTCLLYAQEIDNSFGWKNVNKRPKIGIVLSGGSAHGLSHIGVLRYMEELGIDIDYITGTSMGAIIGGLKAMGYDCKRIEDIAYNMNWDDILSNKVAYRSIAPIEKFHHHKYPILVYLKEGHFSLPIGFINSNKLDQQLLKMFSPASDILDFSKLPIPFICVGVDIENGKITRMDKGRLARSIRGSMAIPGVFAPQEIDGRYIVDGGLMRNFPVEECIWLGADIVIGSNTGRVKANIDNLNSMVDILEESAFMMSISDTERQKEFVDILVTPDVKNLNSFDFNKVEELIFEGYLAAKKQKKKFLELKDLLSKYPNNNNVIPLDLPGFVYLDTIRTNLTNSTEEKFALSKLSLKPRSFVTFDEIDAAIDNIISSKVFGNVSYDVVKIGDKKTLLLDIKNKENYNISLGVNHFSNTNSSIVVQAQARNLLFRLSSLKITGRLSESPALNLEYFLRSNFSSNKGIVGVNTRIERIEFPFYQSGEKIKAGNAIYSRFSPFLMYEFSAKTSLRLLYQGAHDIFRNAVYTHGDVERSILRSQKIGFNLRYDTRDNISFTNSGTLLYAISSIGFSVDEKIDFFDSEIKLYPYQDNRNYSEFELNASQAFTVMHKWILKLRLNTFYRSNSGLLDNYNIGGTYTERNKSLPFIGYQLGEITTSGHLYLRSSIRHNLFDKFSVAIVGNVLIGYTNKVDVNGIDRDKVINEYGVGFQFEIESIVGPIILDIGLQPNEKLKFAFSLGWNHVL